MLIWLLALLIIASLAGFGYRQGAIRMAFSLVGILVGLLLAGPLGHLIKKPLVMMGVSNPLLVWLLAPFVIFLLFSVIFKIAGFQAHHKVDVYFKYHAGELRMALWERLSHRLGLCIGVVNGSIYFILVSFVIYAFSYWTYQVAAPEADATSVRMLNRLGAEIHDNGFAKVDRAIEMMPQSYYDAADVAGLIYQNTLLEARLELYPGFLDLAERAEFQGLGNDKEFNDARQRQAPFREILDNGSVKAITHNPELLNLIWDTVKPNLKDLADYLNTGQSPKYASDKLLGRWDFNISNAYLLLRRAKPNFPAKEMQLIKNWMAVAFAKTTFVATPNHVAIIKSLPSLNIASKKPGSPQNVQGQWKEADDKFELTFSGGGLENQTFSATVENERLTIKGPAAMDLVFDRED
jgi:hypothetical protein